MSILPANLEVVSITTHGAEDEPDADDLNVPITRMSSHTSFQTIASEATAQSAMPWWPIGENPVPDLQQAYHANTQLKNGKLSFIIDPGAWSNLMGKNLQGKWQDVLWRQAISQHRNR